MQTVKLRGDEALVLTDLLTQDFTAADRATPPDAVGAPRPIRPTQSLPTPLFPARGCLCCRR